MHPVHRATPDDGDKSGGASGSPEALPWANRERGESRFGSGDRGSSSSGGSSGSSTTTTTTTLLPSIRSNHPPSTSAQGAPHRLHPTRLPQCKRALVTHTSRLVTFPTRVERTRTRTLLATSTASGWCIRTHGTLNSPPPRIRVNPLLSLGLASGEPPPPSPPPGLLSLGLTSG